MTLLDWINAGDDLRCVHKIADNCKRGLDMVGAFDDILAKMIIIAFVQYFIYFQS